jgi:hypothetical protein
MINDDDYRGECRSFMRSLLPSLYKAGYRYLALEGWMFDDTGLNSRKYPVMGDGFYMREPAYGQMMRDAMGMGFTCIKYEDTATGRDRRVGGETENLYRFIKSRHNGKIVVYSGHGSVYKNHEKKESIPMGEKLCKKLGRDIPVIEAASLVEGGTGEREYTMFKALADSLKTEEPSIIVVSDSAYIVPRLRGGFVNASVYLPRTDYHLGYPDWMCGGKYEGIPVSKDSANFFELDLPDSLNTTNCFMQVYKNDEYDSYTDNAIPVIQFRMEGNRKKYELNVSPGRYYIFIKNENSTNIFEQMFTLIN